MTLKYSPRHKALETISHEALFGKLIQTGLGSSKDRLIEKWLKDHEKILLKWLCQMRDKHPGPSIGISIGSVFYGTND